MINNDRISHYIHRPKIMIYDKYYDETKWVVFLFWFFSYGYKNNPSDIFLFVIKVNTKYEYLSQ